MGRRLVGSDACEPLILGGFFRDHYFLTHFRIIGISVHFDGNEFQPGMAFHTVRRDVILTICKLLSINSGTGIASGFSVGFGNN